MQPYAREDVIPLKTGQDILNVILQLLPNGPYWEWKNRHESNYYKYLLGICQQEAFVYNSQFYDAWIETDLLRTVDDLPIWEKNVGIPDAFLSIDGLTAERRRYNVRSRLFKGPLISRLDYIDFLSSIGYVLGIDYIDILYGQLPTFSMVESITNIIMFRY